MAGDIADFPLSLAAPHLHGVLVVVNGKKFSLVSLSPAAITENPGDTDSWKKPEVENLVSDSL